MTLVCETLRFVGTVEEFTIEELKLSCLSLHRYKLAGERRLEMNF